MKFSPAIQKLVATAERQESTARKRNGHAKPVARPKRTRSSRPSVTGRETARQKEARERRESREAQRGKIELLRYKLRKEREKTKRELAGIRARRNVSRAKLSQQIKRFRAKWRAWVNAQVAEFRRKHRDVWNKRLDSATAELHKLQHELKAERGYQADYRKAARAERGARKTSRGSARRRGAEARQESDDRVESNLPGDLIPIWRSVKNRIKTRDARRTRTEAFLEWVHDHPTEVEAMRAKAQARAWEDIPEQMAEYERRMYEEGRYGNGGEVPF